MHEIDLIAVSRNARLCEDCLDLLIADQSVRRKKAKVAIVIIDTFGYCEKHIPDDCREAVALLRTMQHGD